MSQQRAVVDLDAFRATTPWRFNWENPALYRCDVIQDHLRQVAGSKTGPL